MEFNLSSLPPRVFELGKRTAKNCTKLVTSLSLNELGSIGLLLSSLIAFACVYVLIFPKFHPLAVNDNLPKTIPWNNHCNVYEGRWVPDESYPLYNASLCPFAESGFNCLANGRRDEGYTKWRWRPHDCEIPRFDPGKMLMLLRGKRVVFVGDSLGRSQWESLICMLMTAVEDKRSVYEVNGNKITKRIDFLGVFFSSFNIRIDFYRSVFLVKHGSAPKHAPKRVKSSIVLDKLDDLSHEWIRSDVLVLNTGHWWNRNKLFEMGCYFQMRGALKLGMPINVAFRNVLKTLASWAETSLNRNRTQVFFRTFEASHWSGRSGMKCKVTKRPLVHASRKGRSSFSGAIIEMMKKMTVLHVTPLSAYRSDGHVGKWGDDPSKPDCSHWCLPGVPDTWNEILLAHLSSSSL